MNERLTDNLVRKALSPARGLLIVWDSEVKGFGLRITPGGAKSFLVDYRAGGRQRRMTIGSFPDWSSTAAREQARAIKRAVDLGQDPMEERAVERASPFISDLWERYRREVLVRKAPRAQKDEQSMWSKLIVPRLGRLKVAAVAHEDIDALHRVLTDRGTPVRANRVIEVLRRAFNLAIRWGWRSDNPAIGQKRNPEERRHQYLTPEQARTVIQALDRQPRHDSADAIKLLLLTGARRGEVLGATWDMFDLEAGIWTKPAAFTKQRKYHRVPVSADAVALLKTIRERRTKNETHLFPGSTGQGLIEVRRTWSTVCKEAGLKDFRLHDLRHSFASLAISSGATLPIVGALLGHTQPTTTARYAHLLDAPLREAANKVGSVLAQNPRLKAE